jgi:hypothetical protein
MKEVKTPIGENHAFTAPLQVFHDLKRPLQSQDFLNTHNKLQPLPKRSAASIGVFPLSILTRKVRDVLEGAGGWDSHLTLVCRVTSAQPVFSAYHLRGTNYL